MSTRELQVLQQADLNWFVSLENVWSEPVFDSDKMHGAVRAEFAVKLDMLAAATASSPPGWVIVGQGGTGKTHLLGRFRAECARRHAMFVLVDMTDVADFWDTVLQGYVGSLMHPLEDSKSQFEHLIGGVFARFKTAQPVDAMVASLKHMDIGKLAVAMNNVIKAVVGKYGPAAMAHADTLRAVLAFTSDDFGVSNTAYSWLIGQEVEPDDQKRLGLSKPREKSPNVVRGLSWLMSLRGPTVLAFDALDAIVTQLKLEHEGLESTSSLAIINQIGSGLMNLREATRRTFPIISCVEQTWSSLAQFTLRPSIDRFESPPRVLVPKKTEADAAALVAGRLRPAFAAADFEPPYPTWPFKPEWLAAKATDTPREILRSCHAHIAECVRQGGVREIPPGWEPGPIDPRGLTRLDERFAAIRTAVDLAKLTDEKAEDDRFGPLIQSAVRYALDEAPLPADIDGAVDREFVGAANSKPLHARLRLIFVKDGSREEHVSFRALQRTNAAAFTARLRLAVTQSGIGKAMPFRRLVVLRTNPLPGGKVTGDLARQFGDLGGVWLRPTDDDLRTLDALTQMEKENDPNFDEWLKSRQPASETQLVRQALAPLFKVSDPALRVATVTPEPTPEAPGRAVPGPEPRDAVASPSPLPQTHRGTDAPGQGRPGPDPSPETKPPAGAGSRDLLLGHRLLGDKPIGAVRLPVAALRKHAAIFAGAGSGKTVLLKRLVEEAALLGVPSIVVDVANDLASLGDPWPTPPTQWGAEEVGLARRLAAEVEVVVWTPNRPSGNPLVLAPLPDLSAVVGDAEEFAEAVDMAVDALAPIVAGGPAAAATKKKAVLKNAVAFLGRNGDCTLDTLGDVLRDFPAEATTRIRNEGRIASDMADALSAELTTNAMLSAGGRQTLDPAALLTGTGGRTRVSVLSLVGLPSVEVQRQFVNQLAMILFGWVKRNPAADDGSLRGLLVIDEARDFIPSMEGSACLGSMRRLAAQARKYGLGLVLATQNPKDLDNKIVGQCATQWYGKMNSPTTIAAARGLIQGRGGGGDDVGGLRTGRFYVSNADHVAPPAKVATPMCLSAHGGPMSPEGVVAKAARSKKW